MIFGMSAARKNELKQQRISQMIHGVKQFAYVPARMATGECVWLEHYWAYYHGGQREDGSFFLWSNSPDTFSPGFKAYLDKSDDHISIT